MCGVRLRLKQRKLALEDLVLLRHLGMIAARTDRWQKSMDRAELVIEMFYDVGNVGKTAKIRSLLEA